MNTLMAIPVMIIMTVAITVSAQQQPDINDELLRLRKELTQIQSQRDKNLVERENEKKEYKVYKDRVTMRMDRTRADIDSLKKEMLTRQHASDSLAAQIAMAQQRKHQVDLNKDALRVRLIASCSVFDSMARNLPPLIQGQILSSVALVKSELTAKNIETAEAFNRLSQSVSVVREAMSSIQAGQENSPVADIRGTVCRIRIGCLTEAVADLKAEKCYIWNGNATDGTAIWKVPEDAGMAQNIVIATAIREGKHLPAFVMLPLGAAAKGGVQ